MKILKFLKGILMKVQFNEAQLSRPQQESLVKVLDDLQKKPEYKTNELVVTPVEFPLKLKVKLDDGIEILLGWDAEKKSYELIQETIPDIIPEPTPEPTPEPEPELDLSPVFERAEALANALMNLTKPLNTEQRIEVWIRFCVILSKEFLK